ncbi:sigma 54 modulation protein/ribosomal protein S30EA [Rhodomicrobium vannielii ATCC 17100]|jgi:ribosomal subunit interface protein|uniref:Ribosome hibernation promoting factor n=1 Tax=Rhodomicrobium vannielii (strain ATCC 17100 / DSM 162 / LMG 4299 / NCIMB 10020 / ATH 3.1.1) TaxID=648757 RepID=E3HYS0_RHOVT|nr:ribosome-associated translation inhibitor RaiA [Rhodomicrobium vannielii]ADP69811.1 sigma 54 modulation protein/ribosomal protein S30EA [Rhodomicrobium vannielii ATCC 17100]
MTIKVTGKNIDLGESLREYALNRVESALDKYSGRSVSGQISVEKNTDGFFSHCAIHLESGLDLQSTGTGVDGYASVDSAMERLEKRLRRYKRRIDDHGQGDAAALQFESAGVDYIIDVESADESADTHDGDGAPAVIAESPVQVKALSVSDAVMQLDLADKSFLVFRNAAHGGINVVYRRADGNIGWIDTGGAVTSAKS